MKVRVIGGTARGDEDLCATCRYAYIRKAHTGRTTVHCSMFEHNWHEPTSECNMYNDKRMPLLGDMKEIAWNVTPSSRRRAGFQLTNQEKLEQLVEGDHDNT